MATIACPHCAKPVVIPDVTLPGNLNDVCAQFPQLCKNLNTVQAQLAGIAQSVAEIPTRNDHVIPTKALLEHWKQCPDCRPKAESLGLIKPERKEVKEDKRPFYARPGFGRE